MEPSPIAARVADAGFVASIVAGIAAHKLDIAFVLQCSLYLAGTVSAVAAAWYHWKLARRL